jgi:hypothetical protein
MNLGEFLTEGLIDREEITTPGNMQWVPCDHSRSVKRSDGICDACCGSGRILVMVPKSPGKYSFVRSV